MGNALTSIETVGLSIAFKSVGQAAYVAVLRNWKSTLGGVVVAVLQGGPSLANYFKGDLQDVHWHDVGLAAAFLVWGAVQQDFNFAHLFAPILKAWGLGGTIAVSPVADHVPHDEVETVKNPPKGDVPA